MFKYQLDNCVNRVVKLKWNKPRDENVTCRLASDLSPNRLYASANWTCSNSRSNGMVIRLDEMDINMLYQQNYIAVVIMTK